MTLTAPVITVLPPDRPNSIEIRRQRVAVASAPHVRALCDAIGIPVLVLNLQRQIVLANDTCIRFLGARDLDEVIGQSPGNVLRCETAERSDHGCGTTKACRACGAAVAVEAAARGIREELPCDIVVAGRRVPPQARATAAPLDVAGTRYIVVSFTDREEEERRRVLERIFFHDVLNTAGSLVGLAEVVTESSEGEREEFERLLRVQALRLVEEIEEQRDLTSAEAGTLEPAIAVFDVATSIADVVESYRHHPIADGRHLVVEPGPTVMVSSDPTMLGRSIGNLVKNAIEASDDGDTVTVGHRVTDADVGIRVHNGGEIPADVAGRIFQRPVSTKGAGRGLGTYSVRLLIGDCLGGHVSFTSDAVEGTVFSIRLPLQPT